MKLNLIILLCVFTGPLFAQNISGKFVPPAGRVLVFAGQDNISVGGTEKYHNGYVDTIGVPGASLTTFIFQRGGPMALDVHLRKEQLQVLTLKWNGPRVRCVRRLIWMHRN